VKKKLALLSFVLLVCLVFPYLLVSAGSVTTVSSLMTDLTKENKKSVYDVSLNAPFTKESSGISEYISSETGGLSLSSEIFNISGRNGNDLDFQLVYSNNNARLYSEGTKSASVSQSFGQTVNAYYDIYDTNNRIIGMGAYQYTTSDSSILGTRTIDGNTWVFNGYLQYPSGTSLLKSSAIVNNANPKSDVNAAKNIFGEGWSLSIPWLEVDGDTIFVTLLNGQTYVANFSDGCGLEDYTLFDVVFTRDTTQSNGIDASAYKLIYVNGDTYYYNADGQLILQMDRYNNAITYYWEEIDGLTLLTKMIDSAGHKIDIEYNDTQTVFTCGNKVVRAIKSLIPGQTNQYYLSSIIDAEGRKTTFSYALQDAAFDTLSGTAATNKCANLVEVMYPSGLKSSYVYEKSKKNLGNSGYMEYYKVQERSDLDKGAVYNKIKYAYYNEPDGYPLYKASAIDDNYKYYSEAVDSKGVITRYLYNSEHQLYKTQQEKSRLLNETVYLYYDPYNLPVRVENRTYNTNGDRVSKVDSYGYDYRGNLLWENHPDATTPEDSNEYKTTYQYDYDYNVMTSQKYKQDKDTSIVVRYALTTDKKSVARTTVFSNTTVVSDAKYEYDSCGNITSQSVEKEPGVWATTLYEYSPQYNYAYLTATVAKAVQDADGGTKNIRQEYTYDFNTGNMLTATDGNGNTTKYKYDNIGRVTKMTAADGAYYKYNYDDANNILTETDANKNSLKYYYNGLGNLIKVVEPGANVVLGEYTYDENENQIAKIDGNGNKQSLTYDALARITAIVNRDKAGNLMSQTNVSYNEAYGEKFDQKNLKIAIMQKGNNQTLTNNYYFDIFQRLKKQEVVSKDGVLTNSYTYDYLDNTTSKKGVDGLKTYYFYDVLGNLLKTKDAGGNLNTYGYDGFGNLTSATNALGETIYVKYDALGRQISQQTPYEAGTYSMTKFYYDGAGNLSQRVDAKGNATNYYYNERNLLYAVEQPTSEEQSNIEKIIYDHNGNITEVQTGLSSWLDDDYSSKKYQYDTLSRQIGSVDNAKNKVTYQYDNNGNVIQSTDKNGVTTYFKYDGLNRMTLKYNSKDGDKNKIQATYDLFGNITQMSDQSGLTTYRYDGFGRLVYEKDGDSIKKSYTYDESNRLANFTLTQGSITVTDLSYGYDKIGRLTSVNDSGKSYRYEYDAAGRLVKEENGMTGMTSSYTYYPSGNVKSLIHDNGGDTFIAYQYQYDANGNQIEKDENGNVTQYYYDAMGRIKTAFLANQGIQDYTYDDLGNIESLVKIDGTSMSESDYLYDKDNKLMYLEETCGNDQTQTTFAYDAQGNLTAKDKVFKYNGNVSASESYSYYYNGYNQLANVVTPDNEIFEYVYNGAGLRTQKTNGEDTINYYYDGNTNIVLETDKTGSITARNVWGLQLIERETQDHTYNYLHDAHGDIIGLTDDMGNVIKSYIYDPYGNEKAPAPQGFGDNSTVVLWQAETDGVDNPFRYSGQYLDDETGFYYLRARYYDPETQRFTQEDPVLSGTNLYVYCNNNPIMFVDPSGLMADGIYKNPDGSYTRVLNGHEYVVSPNDSRQGKYEELKNQYEGNKKSTGVEKIVYYDEEGNIHYKQIYKEGGITYVNFDDRLYKNGVEVSSKNYSYMPMQVGGTRGAASFEVSGNVATVTITINGQTLNLSATLTSGAINVDFSQNNYGSISALGLQYTVATQLNNAYEYRYKQPLNGRTDLGLAIELDAHYELYKAGIATSHVEIANMGGVDNDWNAKYWESLAHNISSPFTLYPY